VIAEHRLGWLKGVCDRVVYLRDGEIALDCTMGDFLQIPSENLAAMGLRAMAPRGVTKPAPEGGGPCAIEIQNLQVTYGKDRPALQIDALSLPKGGVIAVIGDNGAGKTTLARCLCGLEKRSTGCVCYGGKRCKRRELLKTSYLVMQDVNHQLFCESVSDEVRLGMDGADEPLVDGTLAALNLTTLSDRHPMSLSGGQKQRVAVAAALLAGKQTLIFDEPTSGLDLRHMRETARLISHTRGKCTSIVVTHDPELILLCCTHVLHLEEGRMRAFYPLDGEGRQKLEQYFITNDRPNGKEEEQIGRKEPGTEKETVEFEAAVCICGES
jgi:energy-coupling factor transport system ATP-binding protein